MLQGLRGHVRNNVVGYVALFFALGLGTAWAAGLDKNSVKSKHIKDGQVKSADIRDESLTGRDIEERTLSLPTGPQGPQGPVGPTGPQGPAGSPDTPLQVRDKLRQVDGPDSEIDADRLDGLDSASLPHIVYETTVVWDPPSLSTTNNCDLKALTGMDLKPGDVVLATDESDTRYAQVQVTAFMMFNIDAIHLQACNNGSFTIDPVPMRLSVMVLR